MRRGQQVLCYQSVLEIGEEVEREFHERTEKFLQKKAQEIYEEAKAQFDVETDRIRDKLKRDMYELYTLRLKQVFCKMWQEFEDYITDREHVLLAEAERNKREAVAVVKKSKERELQSAVENLENNFKLRTDFLAELNRNQIHEEYLQKMNMYNNKWTELVKKAEESEVNKLSAIADNLRIGYQISLLEVIATERDLANRMMEETALYFIQRIHDLQSQIKKLFTSLLQTNEQLKINKTELTSWECLLKDVVGQFQKFVNYVLQAVPGDAEYLISLEKLLERRKESYGERMKDVEKFTEAVHPIPSAEKLSIPESVSSEQMSVVIQTIMESILYRGIVQVTKKPSHEGVLREKPRKKISGPESTLLTPTTATISFSLESALSTTISPLRASWSSCATDKSFTIRPHIEKEDFWDEAGEFEQEYELVEDLWSEFPDLDDEAIIEEFIYGDIWNLDSEAHATEQDLDTNALLYGQQWMPLTELFDGDIEKEHDLFDEYSSIISPTVVTDYLQYLNNGIEASAIEASIISLESKYLSSDFISSTTLDLDFCEDGRYKRTKSMMEIEAARFAKKYTDFKFVGTDLPPTPSVKDTFVQGRILSILDIMRAHPKLHNVLVEP
ncbi:uncharacterized protein isoform X2 [Rhodnius prolixus]